MIKARAFDRNIFNKVKELNICSIKDTNWIDVWVEKELLQGVKDEKYAKEQIDLLKNTFHDAKEYGSILDVKGIDFDFWEERLTYIRNLAQQQNNTPKIKGRLPFILKQARIMQQKYECVVTNPPYMGAGGMGGKLTEFVKKHYKNTKSDLSTVFMEKTLNYAKTSGLIAMINIPVWMFLISYEKLRNNILSNNTIINMLHLGRGVFGSDFGTTAFILSKYNIKNYLAQYRRLYKKQGAVDNIRVKEQWFFEGFGTFITQQENFEKIPGMPIVYWASNKIKNIFIKEKTILEFAKGKKGLSTGNNERFLRFWHEVVKGDVAFNENSFENNYTWFPINKGGNFKKWYGNNEYIINWKNNGSEIKNYSGTVILNQIYYLKEYINLTMLS